VTYSAICSFIHVPFNFSGIGHQIVHAPVLQSRRIWGRKNGLDTGIKKKHGIVNAYLNGPEVEKFITFTYVSEKLLQYILNLQFIDKVVSEVLCDRLMPFLGAPVSLGNNLQAITACERGSLGHAGQAVLISNQATRCLQATSKTQINWRKQ